MAAVVAFVERYPLRRIVLHPRIGKQQYKGEVDLAAFTAFYEECAHPLVYNGDLLTVEDIRKVDEEFPRLRASCWDAGCWPILLWLGNMQTEPFFLPMSCMKGEGASRTPSSIL